MGHVKVSYDTSYCFAYFRLFDWRPDKLRGERSKHERVVIVKNLFDPTVFDKEVSLLLEYQQDLREECSKCGDVRRVAIYDVSGTSINIYTMLEVTIF
jgi:HIV Tat-specific factor 1